MSDALFKATVRLAHSKPHLREHLLPLLKEAKGEVPEAFKKQWKDKDKDNDGKENEPKPDFLKKKEDKKKAGEVPEAFKKQWDKKDKKDDDEDEDGKKASTLRAATIRLAHENPELRKHLLPILAADFDPADIAETEPGALESDSDEPYMKDNFTEQETNELHDKQVGGQLPQAEKAAADLRKATIRLAHAKPHLREHLLPLLQD